MKIFLACCLGVFVYLFVLPIGSVLLLCMWTKIGAQWLWASRTSACRKQRKISLIEHERRWQMLSKGQFR